MTVGTEAAITMLSATIVRGADEKQIEHLLARTADDQLPEWISAAVLRGGEVALLGAAMPGTPTRRTPPPIANAPCPTCPGGRAGPGGAYAFTKPEPGASRGPSGGPRLRLTREPVPLVALARGGGPLGPRAARLLERVEWPGKEGRTTPAAPLTAAEQQRFEAGREVYRNICQGCHQPDGRGQDRVAPPLVGSALALAAPGVPARILLHGKEGPIGLMPPIGFALNDDQIAAVLTYIRREWDQTGTPVAPDTVRAVRAETASRTRPWTNAELASLMEKGR
jgi:mono/diheme cytochrome c family protein